MQRASLKQNISALYALQIANYIIPLAVLPYLVRSIGAEAFGLMTFAYAICFFMVLFVDAGFNITASRDLASVHDLKVDNLRAREIFWSVQLVKLILVLVCAVVLALLIYHITSLRAHWQIYALSFLTVLGSLSFPTWLFQGLEQMRYTTALYLGGRLLSALGIVFFVHSANDVVMATFLQSGATLFSGLLAWPVLTKKFQLYWYWPSWSGLWRFFQRGRHYFFSDFVATALNNVASFAIGLVASKEMVGIFAVNEKLTRALASGFTPIQKALFPKVAMQYSLDQLAGQKLASRLIRYFCLIAFAIAALAIFLSPWVLPFLFGEALRAYAYILQILSLWFALMVISASLAEYGFVAQNKMKTVSVAQNISSVVLLIGILLTLFCFKSYLLVGTALALLHAQIVMVLILWVSWQRSLQHDRPKEV